MPQYSDVSSDYMRDYHAEVLKTRVFGAFLTAVECRKETGLTQRLLANAIGKDETNVSKLLSRPRNWQLSTVSDLAFALNLDFEFHLVDKSDRDRVFLDTGMQNSSIFNSERLRRSHLFSSTGFSNTMTIGPVNIGTVTLLAEPADYNALEMESTVPLSLAYYSGR